MKFEIGKTYKSNSMPGIYKVYNMNSYNSHLSFLVFEHELDAHPIKVVLHKESDHFCKSLCEYKIGRKRLKKTVNSVMYVNYSDNAPSDYTVDYITELNSDGGYYLSAEDAFLYENKKNWQRTVKVKVTAEIEQIFKDEINEI